MNPLLIGALVGAGAGMLKGQEDKKNAREAQKEWARMKEEANQLNEVKSRYSQWTGHRPNDFRAAKPQTPGLLGPMMQGVMTGAMMGQNWQGAQGPATQPNAYAGSANPNAARTQQVVWGSDGDPTGGQGYIPGARY